MQRSRAISGQCRNDDLPEEIFFNRLSATKIKLKKCEHPNYIAQEGTSKTESTA